MKIGLIPVNIGVQSAADMIGLAKHAGSLGYESVVPVPALGANPAEGMAKLAEEVIGH